MSLNATTIRRVLAGTAAASAAVLTPVAALAAPGTHSRTAPAASAIHTPAAPAIPACSTSGLDVWLDTQGNGAAGTIYYNLEFTNLSGSSCTLFGYPGVSAVSLAGTQIGSPASHGGTPATVTLANGATATAVLGITEVGLFPPAKCAPVTAAGLRVYPPGQTQSRVAPFPFQACSKTGEIYLSVRTVQP